MFPTTPASPPDLLVELEVASPERNLAASLESAETCLDTLTTSPAKSKTLVISTLSLPLTSLTSLSMGCSSFGGASNREPNLFLGFSLTTTSCSPSAAIFLLFSTLSKREPNLLVGLAGAAFVAGGARANTEARPPPVLLVLGFPPVSLLNSAQMTSVFFFSTSLFNSAFSFSTSAFQSTGPSPAFSSSNMKPLPPWVVFFLFIASGVFFFLFFLPVSAFSFST